MNILNEEHCKLIVQVVTMKNHIYERVAYNSMDQSQEKFYQVKKYLMDGTKEGTKIFKNEMCTYNILPSP